MGAILFPFQPSPAAQQFAIELASLPTGLVQPLTGWAFYDYAAGTISGPPAASGLSYASGAFTALVSGVWTVLVRLTPANVANDGHYAVADPAYADILIDIPASSATSPDKAAMATVALKAGDAWQVDQYAAAGESPASYIACVVNRIA